VYGYDVETNVQRSQWVGKSSPRPKQGTSESLKCEGEVNSFFFFDWKGIVHHEFVPRDERVNEEFYLKIMKRLREAV